MKINVEVLKKTAHKNPTAETVFTALALRQRIRSNTDLRRFRLQLLKQSGRIVDTDYFEAFKDLEKQGIGSIVYGRDKEPTMFKWNYNLMDVGKSAVDEWEKVQLIGNNKPEIQKPQPQKPKHIAPPVAKAPKAPKEEPTLHIAKIKRGGAEIEVAFDTAEQLLEFVRKI